MNFAHLVNQVQPAEDLSVYTATTPRQHKWSFERSNYSTVVMQATFNGVFMKRCSHCRVWKEAATNFDQHPYDGFSFFRGWYYSKCQPCHFVQSIQQNKYRYWNQVEVDRLRQTGELCYDDLDNPPIMCANCWRYTARHDLGWDLKPSAGPTSS